MALPEDTEAVGPITDQHGGDEGDDQQNGPKRRKNNTSMDLNQIWKLYNDSVEINGVSLSMLVRTKQNDREAGCKQSTSTHWLKKIMKMYCRRANLGFKNIDHINVVCDASRHSVHDCLVSVFYSRHNDIAAYAPTQALRSSKIVHPGEIVCDSEVEKLLAEGSRTRLSGYRLLQAISHQVQLVSDFKLSLTNFLVSDDMEFALQPVASDVTRVVTGTFVRHVKKMVAMMEKLPLQPICSPLPRCRYLLLEWIREVVEWAQRHIFAIMDLQWFISTGTRITD